MDPKIAQQLIVKVSDSVERNPELSAQPILMTSPTLRRHIYKLLCRFTPQIIVLSHSEISADVNIDNQETLELNNAG